MKIKSLLILSLLATNLTLATETEHKGHEHETTNQTETKTPKGIHYGKILSIQNAMGYKYLKVDEDGKELWVAIANAPVKVGEKIGYDKNTIMKNFKSKSLGKEFKEIIFASDVYLPEKSASAPIKDLQDMLGLSAPKPTTVHKADDADEKPAKLFEQKEFYTVKEVYMWKKSLEGKTIKVKGHVQKVAKGIMKLDWVHIEDGTGEDKKRNDDLVFTTKVAKLKADDKVVATGKVVVDKDFGYGYFYKVIIQESSFTPQ